jgi:uncharacterized protein YndB with AHSA1/START domain
VKSKSCSDLAPFAEGGNLDKIIYQRVILACNPRKAFEMFTLGKNLEKWLTEQASIEPEIGGKYELFWNPKDKENDSTIGCKILALSKDKFIAFEWKGPKQFKHFMNNIRPLTNVIVFFIPSHQGTEVHLLHIGWRDTPDWEKAREWFEKTWTTALSNLQKYAGEHETAR